MRKKVLLIYVLVCVIFISGCKRDEGFDITETKEYTINGFVQKGPFINGSDITVSELNSNLVETGRTFNSTIVDDKGTFEISGIELESSFIKIKADGYFYNEVEGDLSDSRIILYAIVDLSNNQAINVNILTSLESERVKHLVSSGESFAAAKAQAKSEVYAIFGFNSTESTPTELYNITGAGADNSILLAISTIILGTHNGAEMTSLINTITTDIAEDGQLDNNEAQSKLINEATLLNVQDIINNLSSKYSESGENIDINNFELYVEQFINTTDFAFTKNIEYPTQVGGYLNMLSDTLINYDGGIKYCFAAHLPDGTSCKVKYKSREGCCFGVFIMENIGWGFSGPSADQWFEISANGEDNTARLPAMFGPPDTLDIFVYENGNDTAFISKTIGY